MITQYPTWVDPKTFSLPVQNSSIPSPLVYDPTGPIPFPKGDPLSSLDELLNSLLIKPLAEHELAAVNKLSKKIKKKKKNNVQHLDLLNESTFKYDLFSNSFTAKNYNPEADNSVASYSFIGLTINSEINIFQSLVNKIDSIFSPAHVFVTSGSTIVSKSYIKDFDLSPENLKDFCSQVKIDPTLIDNIQIDYSSDFPDHCKITIEKRIPF